MADRTDRDDRVHLRVLDVERQQDHGALFAHGMHTETLDRMHDLAAWVWTALELLIEHGLADPDQLRATHQRVKASLDERHWSRKLGFTLSGDPADKYQVEPAQVDCAARLPLCKAVCCHMDHALQITDLKEGVIKFEHARPYFIRRDEHQRCVHLDDGGGCGVFAHRPLTCRRYDCSGDPRVWHDFAGRVPNREVIDGIRAGTYHEEASPMIADAPVIQRGLTLEFK